VWGVGLLWLIAAGAAGAHVPAPVRLHAAIAQTNVAAGRAQAIRLELSLTIGDRPNVATGELVSHPTGLARLELRGAGNLVERHLMQGNAVSASRNGQLLEVHRAFLPPFFILQADTKETLHAALVSFAVLPDFVGLAECGETDCLLIGDPTQSAPRPEPPELPGLDHYAEMEAEKEVLADEVGTPSAGDAEAYGGDSEALALAIEEARLEAEAEAEAAEGLERDYGEGPFARLWVDIESYEVRGFDGMTGVHVELGPPAVFDKLRVPAWILIEEPGKAPARFDVIRAARVAAPASEFSRSWLLTPVMGDAPEQQPPSAPATSSEAP
jgi:hypothetical protein